MSLAVTGRATFVLLYPCKECALVLQIELSSSGCACSAIT